MKLAALSDKRLEAALRHLNSPNEQQRIAKLIFVIAGTQGFRALEAAFYAKDGAEQVQILQWLVSLRWPKALCAERLVANLKEILVTDNERLLCWYALKGLQVFEGKELAPDYRQMLSEFLLDDDVRIRTEALELFVAKPERCCVPILALLLDDEVARVRTLSQLALRKIGSSEANYALYEWEKRK